MPEKLIICCRHSSHKEGGGEERESGPCARVDLLPGNREAQNRVVAVRSLFSRKRGVEEMMDESEQGTEQE